MKFGQAYQPDAWESGMGIINRSGRICLVPKVSGIGGMVTFQEMLVKGLAEKGIEVTCDLADTPYTAILVIGGTRALMGLWRAKRSGVPVIQRLDGMNWIHRKRQTGWRHYLRAEYGNVILSYIRSHLADQIIYQSEFSRHWWERIHGATQARWTVVHNGVDLEVYTPRGAGRIPQDHIRILMVEGAIGGGYEWGLETAIHMAEGLYAACRYAVEVQVVGKISSSLQQGWMKKTAIHLTFSGQVPHAQIPELDRSAHVLYAADLNPACPNSVIEALACGLPVVAFDTGALSELVTPEAGRLVPYGGDPWNLDPPNIDGLIDAADVIINRQADFRMAARKRAEEAFGLERMVDAYLEAMNL